MTKTMQAMAAESKFERAEEKAQALGRPLAVARFGGALSAMGQARQVDTSSPGRGVGVVRREIATARGIPGMDDDRGRAHIDGMGEGIAVYVRIWGEGAAAS